MVVRGGMGVELVIIRRVVGEGVVGEDGAEEEDDVEGEDGGIGGVDGEGDDGEGVWSSVCAVASLPTAP